MRKLNVMYLSQSISWGYQIKKNEASGASSTCRGQTDPHTTFWCVTRRKGTARKKAGHRWEDNIKMNLKEI